MRVSIYFCLFCLSLSVSLLRAQSAPCNIVLDEIDPFDSLRTVAAEAVPLGNLMPSLYEEVDGPKFIREGKALFHFSESDSFQLFFLTIALPEYKLHDVKKGYNIKLILERPDSILSDTIIGFATVPDNGTFDRGTNMRIYQHTGLVPADGFYTLAAYPVKMLRVEYPRHQRTIELTREQGLALREAVRCVGERLNLYPLSP
jgi:hypothetical protein